MVRATDARTHSVATYSAGETITVDWVETVDHPRHDRTAFDADDDFVDPATELELQSNAAVLLDEIPRRLVGIVRDPGTLLDVEGERCTLQAIQVMCDKPPDVPGTNDLYCQCADLVLEASTNWTMGT